MKIKNLGETDGLPPVDWASISDKLATGSMPEAGAANSRSIWLTTLNADGSPHVTPVGAVYVDGAFWFQTGATRKGRNVARDGRCALSLSLDGADVTIEGRAVRVTGRDELAPVVKAWVEQGWPAEVDETGAGITAPFNAPAQGPAPWNVYRIEPTSAVVGVTAEPGGLTRFQF